MIRVTCDVWHCILQPHSRSPSPNTSFGNKTWRWRIDQLCVWFFLPIDVVIDTQFHRDFDSIYSSVCTKWPCQICVIHLKFQNHIWKFKGHLLNNLGEFPLLKPLLGEDGEHGCYHGHRTWRRVTIHPSAESRLRGKVESQCYLLYIIGSRYQ